MVLTVALTVAVIGAIVSIPGTDSQRSNIQTLRRSNVARWQAAWHANLGVLMQTRVELTAYDQHHFGALSIEDVRRQENLTPAGQQLSKAAALDPGSVTARRRQTMIALAHFNYDEAFVLMQAMWDAGHRDRAQPAPTTGEVGGPLEGLIGGRMARSACSGGDQLAIVCPLCSVGRIASRVPDTNLWKSHGVTCDQGLFLVIN